MTSDLDCEYRHTQYAPLYLLLLGFGVVMLGTVGVVQDLPTAPVIILSVGGVVMLLLAASFRELTVADDGDALAIWFGPLPLFCKRIPYADIQAVEAGRTLLLDGWGIHYSPRGGYVWNLWGRQCVVIQHGRTTRVGSDDVENLVSFLRTKLAPAARAGD